MKRRDPFYFEWHVNRGGYQFQETRRATLDPNDNPPKEHFLLEFPEEKDGTFSLWQRKYLPMGDSALFLDFAFTHPDTDQILGFAAQYGLLGADVGTPIEARPMGIASDALVWGRGTVLGRGESLTAWNHEILSMRQAYHVLQMVQNRDGAQLSKHITWQYDKNRVLYASHPGMRPKDVERPAVMQFAEIASERDKPDIFHRFTPGDVYMPAMYHVQSVINKSLENRVAPRLLWDDEDGKPRIYNVPKGLIGALWIQFAQAVEDNKRFQICICQKWFEIPQRGAQQQKQFCSTACKVRLHRRKQASAQKMFGDGMRPEIIADELGVDHATVRKWVGVRGD